MRNETFLLPYRVRTNSDNLARRCMHANGRTRTRTRQDGHQVGYLHPSAIVIDLLRAPLAEAMRFSPVHFNGSELDTGGSLAPYFQTLIQLHLESEAPSWSESDPSVPHPPPPLPSRLKSDVGEAGASDHAVVEARDGSVEGREGERQIGVCFLPHRYADPASCFGKYQHIFGLPDIYDSAFLHVRKSSGWDLLVSDSSRSLSLSFFSLSISLSLARALSLSPPCASHNLLSPLPLISHPSHVTQSSLCSLSPSSSSFRPLHLRPPNPRCRFMHLPHACMHVRSGSDTLVTAL